MAVHFGIDSTRISTNSLRIGGASTLAAAGLTYRQRNNAHRRMALGNISHLHMGNSHMFEKARTALAGSNALTLSDVKRLDTANTTRLGNSSLQRV